MFASSFFDAPLFEPGWVWLAGAGPGDAGLVTLHALHALQSADVVLYDALIEPQVLAMAGPQAELVAQGKRGGLPSCRQTDICARMIEEARRGRRVLRLKGGDPMMFGRGAEEILALVKAGIRYRVIPGVSAGLGGLAYAGIPLTCRGINSAVAFVTGHDAQGKVPELDWAALARGAPVLVLFMALRNLHGIVPQLLAAGRAADEAVAIVRAGTTDEQQVIETTLSGCVEAAAHVEPPALVVIGDVVRLRPALDWLGALAGRELVPMTVDGAAG